MAGRTRLSVESVVIEVAGLDAADGMELVARWRSLTGRVPGPGLRGELLRSALACKLQERAFAGPSPATLRKLALMAKSHEQLQRAKSGEGDGSSSSVRHIKPGSRLIREWQGIMYEVVVTADGYLWNGASHASLSAIAKAITGTHWNGWRFFGVDKNAANLAILRMGSTPQQGRTPAPTRASGEAVHGS